MSLTRAVGTLATTGAEQLRELPMDPLAFGGIALAFFILLLGVLWSFRNTAAKYDTPVRAGRGDSSGQGTQRSSEHGAHH